MTDDGRSNRAGAEWSSFQHVSTNLAIAQAPMQNYQFRAYFKVQKSIHIVNLLHRIYVPSVFFVRWFLPQSKRLPPPYPFWYPLYTGCRAQKISYSILLFSGGVHTDSRESILHLIFPLHLLQITPFSSSSGLLPLPHHPPPFPPYLPPPSP